MVYYFAVFFPMEEGGYAVQFPDFPEAFTQGQDFADAMDMAKDVLAVTVEEYIKARRGLPSPSGINDAAAWAEKRNTDPGLIRDGSTHIQAFAAPGVDSTPIRVSVSFPKSVLEEIDDKAHPAFWPTPPWNTGSRNNG